MFVAEVPGSPGMPEVGTVGKTYVELTWEPPRSDGGSRITGIWLKIHENIDNLQL